MTTNSNSALLATILDKSKKGTFTSLQTTKVGETRGRGAAKAVFGNDEVIVTFISGFKYADLVARSLDLLKTLTPEAIVAECAAKGLTDKAGMPITLADATEAMAEVTESFNLTLDGENESTTDHVYESLIVGKEMVRGGRVYKCAGTPNCKCRNCTGDAKAPLPGTIYIQGLKINEVVVTPAPNGPVPAPASAAKTVAKNAIRRHLPIRRYVSYRLEPGGIPFKLKAGGTTVIESIERGFVVTDDIVALLAS